MGSRSPTSSSSRSPPGGDIGLGTNSQGGSSAYADKPGAGYLGDIYLNNDSALNQDMSSGSFGKLTMLHEIGHTIGLKHPGDYDSVGTGIGPFLPAGEDNVDNTVMSYNSFGSPYPNGPQPYDVLAAQYLYGVERNTGIIYHQSGDILSTTGSTGADRLIGINLGDALSGGAGNDSLFGNANNDMMIGGAGADRFAIEGNDTIGDFSYAAGDRIRVATGTTMSVNSLSDGALLSFSSSAATVKLLGVAATSVTTGFLQFA